MKTNISDLQTKGFVALSYPADLRDAVNKTVESWKKFCSLPLDVKKSLPYSNNSDGVGYEYKDGIGPKADKKENFDITTAGEKWLETNIKQIQNRVALAFVQDAVELVNIMKPTILDFAQQAEEEFTLQGFKEEVAASEAAFFVRFIHYFGEREAGEETASAHADQSGFTLHLFESAAGLQCLTPNREWIDMPVSEGETVIIPDMQMQLRSEGRLTATCHRVIATLETAKTGRYSAVCFVQFKNTPKYDKDKSGRLQEKTPGFNYGMPHHEFKKMFK